jgi:hypothetical protein
MENAESCEFKHFAAGVIILSRRHAKMAGAFAPAMFCVRAAVRLMSERIA